MGVMMIFAFVLLFLVMGISISIPIRMFIRITKLMKNSPNLSLTRDQIRSYLHLAPRSYSPRPDFNVQRPDFNFPNSNQNRSSKPKQQLYFEYTDHGLSTRYAPEIEHLLVRTGCRVEVEIAWLLDYKEISGYGARTGTAGGKPCYIAKFQDQIDRVTGTNEYLVITLCGYAPETQYIGRTQTLYFPDWWTYKPNVFIKSVRVLED